MQSTPRGAPLNDSTFRERSPFHASCWRGCHHFRSPLFPFLYLANYLLLRNMDARFSKVEDDSTISTVSLGMVVIDEIHLPKRSPLIDVAGGSGAYGMYLTHVALRLTINSNAGEPPVQDPCAIEDGGLSGSCGLRLSRCCARAATGLADHSARKRLAGQTEHQRVS